MASFEDIRRQCLEGGFVYTDHDFPAESSSIFYNRTDPTIEWTRAKNLAEDPQFCVDGASKYDLDQGELGDCWFLASAATLATQRDLFREVVPQDQGFGEDYCGAFHFNFWRYGEWTEVVVDDYLPTRNGKLVFCSNRESPNEFWSALLEKAYAKLHKSYGALEGGNCQDALVDFTGGIGEAIDVKKFPEPSNKLFKMIKKLFKKNTLLCAVITNVPDKDPDDTMRETKLDTGLYAGHAYSITDVEQFKLDGKSTRLLRIRNPWGMREWNGAWSDGSEEWESCPDNIKEELDMRDLDDGEFWMSFSDFCEQFDAVQVCYLLNKPPPAKKQRKRKNKGRKEQWNVNPYDGEWIEGATAGGCGIDQTLYWTNPQYFVELTDADEDDEDETCTLIVSLMQKHARMMRTITRSDSCEASLGIDIFKYKGKTPEELDGFQTESRALRMEKKHLTYINLRELTIRYKLEPGLYCVIPNTYQPGRNGKYLLRFATEKPAGAGEVGNDTEVRSGDEKKRKKNRFNELFEKYNGGDEVIDAGELRQIFNDGFHVEGEGFTVPTCREIITSFTDEEMAVLDKTDTKAAWRKVKNLKETFDEYDADKSNTLEAKELRNAFKSLGYKLGKKAQGVIIKKYCGKKKSLSLDDFVLVSFKLANSHDMFTKVKNKKSRKGGNLVELTEEELMEMML